MLFRSAQESEHWQTVANLADACLQLSLVNNQRQYDKVQAVQLSKKIALLFAALEQEQLGLGDPYRWRTKPKLHLMEEFVEYQSVQKGAPCKYWTYKDESWGAWLAKVSMRRGGKKVACSLSLNCVRTGTVS